MKFSSVSFIAVIMSPPASSLFGNSSGGASVSHIFVCVWFDLYDDRPKRRPNRRRYDMIHRQDVFPTVDWTLSKETTATSLFRYTQSGSCSNRGVINEIEIGSWRHRGDEISSHPFPNKELIRVQNDDETIQKFSHHHHPRANHQLQVNVERFLMAEYPVVVVVPTFSRW
jgi:hypothetical protein